MHAFALIGSRNLVVVMPSGSCYRNERKNETVSDKPGIQESKRKTGNSLTSYNTSFVTHVLFKIQEQRRVFIQPIQDEHVFQHDDSTVLVSLVTELATVSVGPNSSSEPQPSNFLSLSIRSVQHEAMRETHLCIYQSSSSPPL